MKVIICSPIDPDAVDALRREHDVLCSFQASEEELPRDLRDREVLVFRSGISMTANLLDDAPCLRMIVRAGSGLDNLDLDHARSRGIRVVRVPGPSAQAVGELAFALMLSLMRKVVLADGLLRQGHWPKHELGGPLLRGKCLGIVGLGNIGSRVGELAVAWGMRVVGSVEHPSHERRAAFQARGMELTDTETVLREADVVSIHLPLKESTLNLIDEQALARMRTGSFLINAARGGIVDERALAKELSDGGRLAGAALDTHSQEGEGVMSPFRTLSNVVLTPHIGGMAVDSQREIGERVFTLIEAFAHGSLESASQHGELVI